MATVAAPAPASQAFSFGSVLSGAWNTALSTFERWVDSELGAEVALEQEALASQATQAAEQAPGGSVSVAGMQFSTWTLAAVGIGAAAILFLVLRK